MGQAKQRGTYEQRKAQSIFYKQERERLDAWLYARRKRRLYYSNMRQGMAWASVAFGISINQQCDY